MSLPQVNTMPPQSSPASVYVLGVRVDRISQQEALDRVEQMIARRQATGNTLACQRIVTVNPEFVMAAQRNKDFCVRKHSAPLPLSDRMRILWHALSSVPLTHERVLVSDTLPPFLTLFVFSVLVLLAL